MTSPLTPERKEKIRERVEKATEGPWYFTEDDTKEILVVDGEDNPIPVLEYGELSDAQVNRNWDFVENARMDLPDLLESHEALVEALTQLKAVVLEKGFPVGILAALKAVVDGYDYNPGDSDLDNEQHISVRMTLGDYRRAARPKHELEGK